MPSKEWLDQHFKVSAYLKPELGDDLIAWMEEQKIKQVSQAVVAILEHYLRDNPPSEISHQVFESRVEQLEKEIEQLRSEFAQMKQVFYLTLTAAKSVASNIKKTKSEIIAPTGRIEFKYTEEEAKKGLTKTELCRKLKLNIYQADQIAKQENLSPEEYLFQISGWKATDQARPRYFPADEAENQQASDDTEVTTQLPEKEDENLEN